MPQPPIARHVLITGASTGIGRECALHLAARGYHVWAGVRNPADGQRLESDARPSAGGSLRHIRLDVADSDSIAAAAAVIAQAAGEAGVHAIVNNAGIGVAGPVEFVSLADWRRQFEVNVFGQIAVTQAFLPLLRKHVASQGGPSSNTGHGSARIIMVSSIAGLVSQPILSPYCASKHALEAVSDSLRIELASQGIHTCLVQPGAVQSEIWRKGQETVATQDRTQPSWAIYGDQIRAVEAMAAKAAAGAVPASRVAEAVERCLTRRFPPTRVLVGFDARMGAFAKRLIPTRLWDRLLARAFGIRLH